MTAVSKKSRIITRFRYRRTDLLRQGKWRRSSSRNHKPGGRAPSICQRVEDNAFHLSKVDRLLRRRCETVRRRRKTNSHELRHFTPRKTPPSGRPGQVKALDGVSPQPQDRQRLACVNHARLVEVFNFACNHAPLNARRRADCVSQLRCVVILVGVVLILFVGLCSRRDHG